MDPDRLLQQIREARGRLFSEGEPYDPDDVRALLEDVDALDVWLSRGGYLPSAWTR